MELFKHLTGIKVEHVPYKGTGLRSSIRSQATCKDRRRAAAVPHLKTGRLRALGSRAQARHEPPDVRTMIEDGIQVTR